MAQRKKTGGRKRRKRRKRRDVDVRNGREMVAGWSRDGRGMVAGWSRDGRGMVAGLTRKWMVILSPQGHDYLASQILRIESWKPACEAGITNEEKRDTPLPPLRGGEERFLYFCGGKGTFF